MVGSSRAPSLPTADLGPGATAKFDYYPRGHLDGVTIDSMNIEVEQLIGPDVEQFFCELEGARR